MNLEYQEQGDVGKKWREARESKESVVREQRVDRIEREREQSRDRYINMFSTLTGVMMRCMPLQNLSTFVHDHCV